ncbi:MAG: YbhB/YbcL family Raf kinase inhibitor-like protein [Mycobacterium sp.]
MIGRLLRPIRASAARGPLAAAALTAPHTLTVTSPAFADGDPMPVRCAGPGVGDNVSPELRWQGLSGDTRQLILGLDDVDVPLPMPLLHNVAVLAPSLGGLDEGAFGPEPGVRVVPTRLSSTGYSGPRPIPGHGPHRYRFQLLALDCRVPGEVDTVKAVLAAAAGHVLARGMLTGTYER